MSFSLRCVALGVLIMALSAGCGCNGSRGEKVDAGQDAALRIDACVNCPEASIPDAYIPPDRYEWHDADMRPDAQWPPVPVSYDFCDAGFFKLPINGETELSYGVDLWGDGVVYEKRPAPATHNRLLHYFNISECKEYALTQDSDDIGRADIWNNLICLPLCRDCTDEKGSDLFMVDVESWERYRLTNTTTGAIAPMFNGTYVAYLEYEPNGDSPNPPPMKLMVWDTVTDEATEIYGATTPYYNISDRYVAWAGYFGLPGQVGKDIAYYDLQTKETVHIDSTLPWNQMVVDVWEDNIVWGTAENDVYAPFHSKLYNITTQTETEIVSGDETLCYGNIHENLVAYNSTQFRDPQLEDVWPSDLMLYDIELDLHRRVTTEPSNLGRVEIFFPYILVVDVLDVDPHMNDFYIIDMVKMGLVDEQGSLLPGGPVLTPP